VAHKKRRPSRRAIATASGSYTVSGPPPLQSSRPRSGRSNHPNSRPPWRQVISSPGSAGADSSGSGTRGMPLGSRQSSSPDGDRNNTFSLPPDHPRATTAEPGTCGATRTGGRGPAWSSGRRNASATPASSTARTRLPSAEKRRNGRSGPCSPAAVRRGGVGRSVGAGRNGSRSHRVRRGGGGSSRSRCTGARPGRRTTTRTASGPTSSGSVSAIVGRPPASVATSSPPSTNTSSTGPTPWSARLCGTSCAVAVRRLRSPGKGWKPGAPNHSRRCSEAHENAAPARSARAREHHQQRELHEARAPELPRAGVDEHQAPATPCAGATPLELVEQVLLAGRPAQELVGDLVGEDPLRQEQAVVRPAARQPPPGPWARTRPGPARAAAARAAGRARSPPPRRRA
jgi:hypothetical protein